MPIFLSQRQPDLVEHMDQAEINPGLLQNTYLQFAIINLLLSKWKRVYKQELRPLMHKKNAYTLLDIGFGGGDISVKLAEWAKNDGILLNITAIDTDRRAFEFAKSIYPEELVTWKHASSSELVAENQTFDFVISNHVLHHLADYQIYKILSEAKHLARQKVVFNDIRRSDTGYFLFNIFSRTIFRNSFITADGLTSIKRSFTFRELKETAPPGWRVKRMFPFRLLLIYDKNR